MMGIALTFGWIAWLVHSLAASESPALGNFKRWALVVATIALFGQMGR